MSMSNLPSELVEDIISRVPLRSMRTVRLTCKKWNTIEKSELYKDSHWSSSSNKGRRVSDDRGEELQSLLSDRHRRRHLRWSIYRVYADLTCLDEQVKIYKFFHCEGDITRLVVWYPYSGQTSWIEPRSFCYLRGMPSYALGYAQNLEVLPGNHYFCEIYDFDSNLWKTLDVTSQRWRLPCYDRGRGLKGNTYWCTQNFRIEHIIYFHFTSERFGPLLPLPLLRNMTLCLYLVLEKRSLWFCPS
ncbi:hypothetical protein EUTSA_v10000454mg [Eutrema salsugineum]|uniref:F-box domain-containing protein n=1 Tax=Eutrema salsugineum TaxID=72664 RepID=V4L890_EUTSA|nr:hypothetical protein EUTSA_v10000454mg [Eutrema salsugineum]